MWNAMQYNATGTRYPPTSEYVQYNKAPQLKNNADMAIFLLL
jgi:hypothetical protein